MKGCINMKALMEWQIEKLRQHIQDNQYYLGQKLHHSISWKDAEHDFFLHYTEQVCSELRITYCGNLCSMRDQCEVYSLFKELSGSDQQ